jgi:hypothetical protein
LPGDFWLEGGGGLEHHSPPDKFDASVDLSTLGCASCSLNAAWAIATDDVWFVGDEVLHFDGAGWKVVPMPVATVWRGVSGSSRADVWAVGDSGAIVHLVDAFRGAGSLPSNLARHRLQRVVPSAKTRQ